MFDIGSSELLLIIIVAIVVIGPKDLPRALYKVGQVVGKAKGMARHFRTGIDAMIREAELEDLQKQWAQENARIMAETQIPDMGGTMKPLADETAESGAPAQLPAPDESTPDAPAAPVPPPFQNDPGPAIAETDQPSLPLDGPHNVPASDASKGSSAA